jgi:DNA (cytosine-5)-methyltransferase 3A
MSCGQIALNKLSIKINRYYASEIKPHAIKVTQYNFPNTIQLGDVRNVSVENMLKIDLLIGGSPCQDLSQGNKNRKGLKGEKSSLFWEYIRVLKEVKPKYFMLENVEMPDEDKQTITDILGVYPVNINSSLVSAQYRNRWYWTNIPGDEITMFGNLISQPKDKKIKLQDILENGYTDREKARALLVSDSRPLTNKKRMMHRYKNTGFTTIIYETPGLSEENIRYLLQVELERLQTVPEGYTKILTRNKAADVLGDGWTVDVIAHIFKNLKGEFQAND